MVARQATQEDRDVLRKAADREFRVLERLDHPGVVRADLPTECDHGPVLFLRTDPDAQRLDHFLQSHGGSISVDLRLDILRQLADVVRYAHGRHVVHRSLSPQCIMVRRDASLRCTVQVFNWQTGIRLGTPSTAGASRVSATLHAGQLLEDASLVYLAPEALTGGADGGTELDLFSLGALAYLLFTDRAPAASQAELQEKLRQAGALNITEVLDGAVDALQDLVRYSANPDVSLRYDIAEFLQRLNEVEEQLTRPSGDWVSPLVAKRGDRLEGGFTVLKRLGGGSASIVHQVERAGTQLVLKAARKPEDNPRIQTEYEVLKRLRWPQIVAAHDLCQFGDLAGFTMDCAGEATLAHQLREEGPLDLTLLQQFGEDLLRTIEYLDKEGIPHRDLKPENVGVRVSKDKKRKELCLFDFSLASTPPENIAVGTFPYLDSFLATRKVKRWDVKSECFSAAMTLHEMATGALPKWGDGQSARDLIPDEVTLQAELFPAELRDRFKTFFLKALRRDYAQRFDNPAEMIEAWRGIFATIDRPYPEARAEAPFILSDQTAVAEGTQLILLDLSTRLSNALDRLDIHSVGQLLRFPLRRIYRLRGVGHKTRRELGKLFKALRERLPQIEAAVPETPPTAPVATAEESRLPVAVDAIARQVAVVGRGTQRQAEQQILQRYLGWLHDEGALPTLWPSQNELADQLDLTRQRIGQAVLAGRGRWARLPVVIALRDELLEVLRANGGITTHDEAIAAILAAHGSTLDEPACTRMASVATRAAVEAEKARLEERYNEYRSGDRIFLSVSHDLKQYALKLGLVADRLAGQDPLPAPGIVLETLRAVPQPLPLGDLPLPADNRLPALAAAASASAALTSRLELYPRGMAAERALALAQNALFGATLTVEELHSRVRARYPEAAPLPARPDLDALIQRLGLELRWNPAAADGRGAYEPTYRDTLSISTSQPAAQRFSTRLATTPPVSVEPAIAEARALEDKLQYSVREGAFIVLSVDARLVGPAQRELQRRFPVELCNLDDVFLRSLRQQADQRGARWDVVLRADAAEPQSADWRKLQRLVDGCLPDVEKALRSSQATRLAINPGLLARYDRMDLLARLADDVGRTGGIHGLWLLVTANDQTPLPTLNRKAIPITNAAQHVRLTEAWINNRHRSAAGH